MHLRSLKLMSCSRSAGKISVSFTSEPELQGNQDTLHSGQSPASSHAIVFRDGLSWTFKSHVSFRKGIPCFGGHPHRKTRQNHTVALTDMLYGLGALPRLLETSDGDVTLQR